MDEHKEEGGPVGNHTEPMEEATEHMEEHGVPVKTETLDGKVDVPVEEPINGDVDMVEFLDSSVCNSTDPEVASGTVKGPNGGENHGADGLSEPGVDTSVRVLEAEDGGKDDSVSGEKPEEANVGRAEELGGSVDAVAGDTATPGVEIKNGEVLRDVEGAERTCSAVEGEIMDAMVMPETESKNVEPCGDAETADEMVTSAEVKMTDDTVKLDTESKNGEIHGSTGVETTEPGTKSKNGEIHESTGIETTVSLVGSEVNDEKAKQEAEVKNSDACDTGTDVPTEESQPSAVDGKTLVNEGNHAKFERDDGKAEVLDREKSSGTTEIKGAEEKEATQKTEEDNKKMDVEYENTIQKGEDKKVDILHDEKGNSESEIVDAKPPEPLEAPEENSQAAREETAVLAHRADLGTVAKVDNACASAEASPSTEKRSEEQVCVSDKGDGKAEAMEIDSIEENLSHPQEEQLLKVDTVDGSKENAGVETADANTVQSQEVPGAEADCNDSNTEKKMEIEKTDVEEQKDNDAANGESTDKIVSTGSAEPDGIASTGSAERRGVEEEKDNDVTIGECAGKIESTGSAERRDVKEEKDNDATTGDCAGKIESMGLAERKDVEEQMGNDATTGEFTDKIVPTGSAEPDGHTEEAVSGEVAPLDHNVLFDPNSDIAKFIDFSGVLPWSGNTQEIKAETKDVPVDYGTRVTDKADEVPAVDDQKGVKPDVQVQGSVENVQESLLEEPKGEGTTANTTSCDPNTVDDMEIDKRFTDSENLSPMEIDKQVTDSENLSMVSEGTEKNFKETHTVAGPESSAPAADGPQEVSDANLGSSLGNYENLEPERQQEEKVQECLEKKPEEPEARTTEQEGVAHEAPSNQEQDTKLEEKLKDDQHFDEGTGSDAKTNELKRKADALGEDSSQARKTISVAKVSTTPPHLQKPSFKIGECIARAASQMAGSPSVLRGNNVSDENLSVENFLNQLHSAATEPEKGNNNVSEIAAGFFLDYRNSLVSQQFASDKVSGKRGRPSNSITGGAEAFEFEEMSDTYWTDRVIHNGGEEQTPSAEKTNYQIVPVELKPAQVQRGRRPYTKRRHSENSNNSHLASEKPVGIDENSPAELIMNFSETDTLPSEMNLNKMFRHFGPIRESQTEVDSDNCRARVVFKKCADAEVAYNSAGRFNIFGSKIVNYELSYTITEPFKVQPYVVTLGEEDAALCLPSQT